MPLTFLLEWIGLLFIGPFLIFPTFHLQLTFVALIILIIIWGVTSLLYKQPWPSTPFNGILLLFAIMLGVGISVTTIPELTLPKATGLILGLAIFRAVAWTANYREGQSAAIIGFYLLGLGIVAVGVAGVSWSMKVPVLQRLVGKIPQRMVYLPEAPEKGVSPNQLAGIIAFYLPFPLASLFNRPASRGNLLGKVVAFVTVIMLTAVLILTQSRSGWLGGIVGVIVTFMFMGLLSERRWLRIAGTMLPIIIAIGVTIFVLWVGPDRIGEALYGAAESFVETPVGKITYRGRLEIWSRALYAIQDFPFTGCGLGTFRRIAHILYPLFLVPPGQDFAHAHNIFLQVALDLGIPGLVAYLALLGLTISVAWQVASMKVEFRPFALGLLAGLVALHIYGLTDALALGSKPGLAFWMGLGLIASMANMSNVKGSYS